MSSVWRPCGLVVSVLVASSALAFAPVAGANPPGSTPGEIQGNALTVTTDDAGHFQADLAGSADEFFDPTSLLGDGGLTVDFPAGNGNPAGLAGHSYGADGNLNFDASFLGTPTGNGSVAIPYQLTDTYDAKNSGAIGDNVQITEEISYVEQANNNPTDDVTVGIQVINNTSSPVVYHAYWVNDLYDHASQNGTGVYVPGALRFVGAESADQQNVVGLRESTDLSSQLFSHYFEAGSNGEFAGPFNDTALPDSVDPTLQDDSLGAEWDGSLTASGGIIYQEFTLRLKLPPAVTLTPASQTTAVGGTAFVSVHAQNPLTSAPVANKPLTLTITGANPQVLPGSTDANGNAIFTYKPSHAGAAELLATVTQATAGLTAGASGTVTVPASSPGTPSPSPPATGPGSSTPHATPSAPICATGAVKPTKAGGHAVALSVTCNEAVALAVTGKATPPASQHRLHGRIKRPVSLKLKPVVGTASANVPVRLTIGLPGAAGTALAGGSTVRLALTISARNAGGLTSQRVLSVSVKGLRKHATRRRR